MNFRTIIEPFRIKSVEAVKFTRREDRMACLDAAGQNVFLLHAEDVLIDLLTDSGTGAMSAAQWAALMQGDESYAGGRSYYRFRDVVKDLTGYTDIVPTHQGRAAERILFHTILHPGDIVPNNCHFDTTRANIEVEGAEALDLVIPEGHIPSVEHPFKGNMDLEALEQLMATKGDRVPLVMVTVTNNSGGGQPVSLENLRGVRAICDRYDTPFFLDACRFAENAYFIKLREPGQGHRTPKAIAQEMFRLSDGCTMSAKKDGLANIGGFLGMTHDEWIDGVRTLEILTEGFPTYGGLAGYDLEAIATGLEEVVQEPYLRYRISATKYLGDKLIAAEIPIIRPPGGHAIYIDARALLSHVPPLQYPGISLSAALYIEAGVRAAEIGTVMFGLHPDGTETAADMDLVRLAIPRRVYTQSHIDYVAEAVLEVARLRDRLHGYRIVSAPKVLRHFTARFQEIRGDDGAG